MLHGFLHISKKHFEHPSLITVHLLLTCLAGTGKGSSLPLGAQTTIAGSQSASCCPKSDGKTLSPYACSLTVLLSSLSACVESLPLPLQRLRTRTQPKSSRQQLFPPFLFDDYWRESDPKFRNSSTRRIRTLVLRTDHTVQLLPVFSTNKSALISNECI